MVNGTHLVLTGQTWIMSSTLFCFCFFLGLKPNCEFVLLTSWTSVRFTRLSTRGIVYMYTLNL